MVAKPLRLTALRLPLRDETTYELPAGLLHAMRYLDNGVGERRKPKPVEGSNGRGAKPPRRSPWASPLARATEIDMLPT
jgi:hypothetical protein